jgi:hypothetical protein
MEFRAHPNSERPYLAGLDRWKTATHQPKKVKIMLYISFTVPMVNYGINSLHPPQGPLFHRWLPNGREDAIDVPVKDARNRLQFWFERRGYSDNTNFIIYDKKREEIDEKIMRLQAKLDAGQLWGEAKYAHASKAELTAVRENRISSEEYIALGERLVKFLSEPIGVFIDVLSAGSPKFGIFTPRLSCSAEHERAHLKFRVMLSKVGKRMRGNDFMTHFFA